MRLPLLPSDGLNQDQRAIYDRVLKQIERGGFTAFKTRDERSALLDPWGVFLHEPPVEQAHYDQVEAVSALKRLPDSGQQVAILVTGAFCKAAYELYAHAAIAEREDMALGKVAAALAAAQRRVDLTLTRSPPTT